LEERKIPGLILWDAEARNKMFAYMYFLDLFFRSPFGCSKALLVEYTTKTKGSNSFESPSDEVFFDGVGQCMHKILNRNLLERLPATTKNSEVGTHKLALYVVATIVEFNTGVASLKETEKFLLKLPGGQGDMASSYKKVQSKLVESRYMPFDQEVILATDVDYLIQVLHLPSKRLCDALVQKLVGQYPTDDFTGEQTRFSRVKKMFQFHVNRQVNSSWMKIVVALGSVVRPTCFSCPGKHFFFLISLPFLWFRIKTKC
jgi:hypothetical protein